MKVTAYEIIQGETPWDLERHVADCLKQGFMLHGDTQCVVKPADAGTHALIWFQPMVKLEERVVPV